LEAVESVGLIGQSIDSIHSLVRGREVPVLKHVSEFIKAAVDGIHPDEILPERELDLIEADIGGVGGRKRCCVSDMAKG
jgi:hypothetical protein